MHFYVMCKCFHRSISIKITPVKGLPWIRVELLRFILEPFRLGSWYNFRVGTTTRVHKVQECHWWLRITWRWELNNIVGTLGQSSFGPFSSMIMRCPWSIFHYLQTRCPSEATIFFTWNCRFDISLVILTWNVPVVLLFMFRILFTLLYI